MLKISKDEGVDWDKKHDTLEVNCRKIKIKILFGNKEKNREAFRKYNQREKKEKKLRHSRRKLLQR